MFGVSARRGRPWLLGGGTPCPACLCQSAHGPLCPPTPSSWPYPRPPAGKFGMSAAVGVVAGPKPQQVLNPLQTWTYAPKPGGCCEGSPTPAVLPQCRAASCAPAVCVCAPCPSIALCRPPAARRARAWQRHHLPAAVSGRAEHAVSLRRCARDGSGAGRGNAGPPSCPRAARTQSLLDPSPTLPTLKHPLTRRGHAQALGPAQVQGAAPHR